TRRALSQKLQLGINLLTGRVSLPASQKRTESMSAQPEVWRVSTIEGIFETDLETLRQWIVEGCVLPTDKVSKGKLSWIEAGKAPMLRAAFRGEHVPATPPPSVAATDAGSELPPSVDVPDHHEVEYSAADDQQAPRDFVAG